jgi:hypothetical protein
MAIGLMRVQKELCKVAKVHLSMPKLLGGILLV